MDEGIAYFARAISSMHKMFVKSPTGVNINIVVFAEEKIC